MRESSRTTNKTEENHFNILFLEITGESLTTGSRNTAGTIPVLDVFPDDEEIGLDKPLDDLTVPLLSGRQLPGNGNRLGDIQSQTGQSLTCYFSEVINIVVL